jgi:preprotein translocase subunit Sec63
MNQLLIGIIIVLSLGSYYLYNQNQILQANNVALEGAVATQEETIATMQNDFALQTAQLGELQKKSQEAQLEMNRYLDIFKRHNLTKLAAAKPGLLEPKINNGTKNVFDSIEEISRTIDALDNGVELQSNPD